MRVRVVCDNSACKSAVSGIKLKLKRKIDIQGIDENLKFVSKESKVHIS